MYKGVVQLSPDNWAYTITIDGQERQMDGEPNARSAADCYDARMRSTRCRVVNTVLYRFEVQAVAGEDDETTLQRHYQARAAARPARPPKPPPAHPLYKGVQQTAPTDFTVIAYVCMTRKRLGVYKTAEQAAGVYDTEMRRQGILAVNFPRLGTREYKAVPDAADDASPPARPAAMAAAPVPHSPDELAAAAQVAAPLLARLRQEDAREQQLPRAPPPAVKPQKVAKPAPVLASHRAAAAAAAALQPPQELRVDDDVTPDDDDAMPYDDDDDAAPVDDGEAPGDNDAAPGDAALADVSGGGSGLSRRQRRPRGYYSALMSSPGQPTDMRCESCKTQRKGVCGTASASLQCSKRTSDMPPPSQATRSEAKPPSARVLAALRGASAAAPPVPSPPAAAETEAPEAVLPPFSLKVTLHCSPPKPKVPSATAVVDASWTWANGAACAALFKGIEYRSSCRAFNIQYDEQRRPFPTAQAAADAYDAMMREQGCPVVNTPLFDGDIQAVRGEKGSVTMRRTEEQQQRKRRSSGGAAAGGACIGASPPSKKPKPPAVSVPSPPAVDAPVVAAPVQSWPLWPSDAVAAAAAPVLPPLVSSPPCDLILPASMMPAAAKRPAEDAAPAAAEAAPPSKRARTAADSEASRDASPNGSLSANKACSANAPPPQMPVPTVAAPPADLPPIPVPMPMPPPVAPAHDLPAFLRRIAPPLRDLDAALAAAEGDPSLTVAALRDSLRGPPDQALMGLHLASELLGLQCGGDKLALLQALQGAPPAMGIVPTAPEDAADELAAFLRGIKLVDIEAAVDAAADSGLTVAALRRAARQGGPHAALCVRLIFTMLRVTRGGDKLTLQRALMSA